jgi:hypothetical protein
MHAIGRAIGVPYDLSHLHVRHWPSHRCAIRPEQSLTHLSKGLPMTRIYRKVIFLVISSLSYTQDITNQFLEQESLQLIGTRKATGSCKSAPFLLASDANNVQTSR